MPLFIGVLWCGVASEHSGLNATIIIIVLYCFYGLVCRVVVCGGLPWYAVVWCSVLRGLRVMVFCGGAAKQQREPRGLIE